MSKLFAFGGGLLGLRYLVNFCKISGELRSCLRIPSRSLCGFLVAALRLNFNRKNRGTYQPADSSQFLETVIKLQLGSEDGGIGCDAWNRNSKFKAGVARSHHGSVPRERSECPASLGQDDSKKTKETRTEENWKAPERAARKRKPVSADERSLARGKELYGKECVACHGEHGKGDGPKSSELERKPRVLADPKLWQETDGELFWKISEGKTPMPTFQTRLSEEKRWDIINYIRTLAPKPGMTPRSEKTRDQP